jgi:hypothetical protein
VAGSANQVVYKNSGNTPAGSTNLTFDGTNLVVGGDITAFSDARLKTNVKTIENPLIIIRQLRGVNYDRTDTGESGSGVIAQETLSAMPVLVRALADGTLTVNYGNFAGLFIEGFKALEDQIIELKAEIVKLKEQK